MNAPAPYPRRKPSAWQIDRLNRLKEAQNREQDCADTCRNASDADYPTAKLAWDDATCALIRFRDGFA